MRASILRAACGLLLVLGQVHGGLISRRSLVDLEQSADLIVVGTASAGIQAGAAYSFVLQVSRVLKGSAVVGSALHVDWQPGQGTLTGGSVEPAAGNGLWFLQGSSGGWVLLPVMQGTSSLTSSFIPTPPGPSLSAYAYTTSASLSDKVASEVCWAIESANGGGTELLDLQLGILDELASPVVQLLYKRMSGSSSPQQRIVGLSGLIRAGSGAALKSAVQAISSFDSYPAENGVLLSSIEHEFRATDASSVVVLGQIAVNSANPVSFREAAAHALRSIHTVDSLPYLAALLGDPGVNLQAEGVGGLASFANGMPVQTPANSASLAYLESPPNATYRNADTAAHFALGDAAIQHLSFWQGWWLENKSAVGLLTLEDGE